MTTPSRKCSALCAWPCDARETRRIEQWNNSSKSVAASVVSVHMSPDTATCEYPTTTKTDNMLTKTLTRSYVRVIYTTQHSTHPVDRRRKWIPFSPPNMFILYCRHTRIQRDPVYRCGSSILLVPYVWRSAAVRAEMRDGYIIPTHIDSVNARARQRSRDACMLCLCCAHKWFDSIWWWCWWWWLAGWRSLWTAHGCASRDNGAPINVDIDDDDGHDDACFIRRFVSFVYLRAYVNGWVRERVVADVRVKFHTSSLCNGTIFWLLKQRSSKKTNREKKMKGFGRGPKTVRVFLGKSNVVKIETKMHRNEDAKIFGISELKCNNITRYFLSPFTSERDFPCCPVVFFREWDKSLYAKRMMDGMQNAITIVVVRVHSLWSRGRTRVLCIVTLVRLSRSLRNTSHKHTQKEM